MARFRAASASKCGRASAGDSVERRPATRPRKQIVPVHKVEFVLDPGIAKMIPAPGTNPRFERLLPVKIRCRDQALGEEAVRIAAAFQCALREATEGTDVAVTQALARYFAVEAAVTGRLDPRSALRRANVDRYLTEQIEFGSKSLRSLRWMFYSAGCLLHPGEFPRENAVAYRTNHVPAAAPDEVRRLYGLVPTLPTLLAQRLQAVVDLCWGVGARRADFRYLKGNSISVRRRDGRPVALVELRNNSGGTRLVPAIEPILVDNLARLSDYAGDGLVLAPHKQTTHRNELNRVAEGLRKRGHRGYNPVALRHRWMVDLAEQLPAALVLYLADIGDLRVISLHQRIPEYKLERILTAMEGLQR